MHTIYSRCTGTLKDIVATGKFTAHCKISLQYRCKQELLIHFTLFQTSVLNYYTLSLDYFLIVFLLFLIVTDANEISNVEISLSLICSSLSSNNSARTILAHCCHNFKCKLRLKKHYVNYHLYSSV